MYIIDANKRRHANVSMIVKPRRKFHWLFSYFNFQLHEGRV